MIQLSEILVKSNSNDMSSFFKLERRTSLVYKELISRNIYASSAYKLPESLKKIYDKSVSTFNSEMLALNETNNKTPSPLKKKHKILNVLSVCRQSILLYDNKNYLNTIEEGKTSYLHIKTEILQNKPKIDTLLKKDYRLLTEDFSSRKSNCDFNENDFFSKNKNFNLKRNNQIEINVCNTSNNPQEDRFCRICKEDETALNQLISICNCIGSVKYSHSECIIKYIKNISPFRNQLLRKKCEICGCYFKYKIDKKKMCVLNLKNRKVSLHLTSSLLFFTVFLILTVYNIVIFEFDFLRIILAFVFLLISISILFSVRRHIKYSQKEEWILWDKKDIQKCEKVSNTIDMFEKNRNCIEEFKEEKTRNYEHKFKSCSPKKRSKVESSLHRIKKSPCSEGTNKKKEKVHYQISKFNDSSSLKKLPENSFNIPEEDELLGITININNFNI
jgi:hypothetical protein